MAIEFSNGYQIISNKPFYSNIDSYIINGERQASTGATFRENILVSRRMTVVETITITGFRMVRIPTDNWTTLSTVAFYSPNVSLAVVAGSGGTIDGGTSSKSFETKAVTNRPNVTAQRATQTWQYDINTIRAVNNSMTTLTPGEYNLTVSGKSGIGNLTIATLTNSLFPIDTTKKIYPSSNVSTHFVIEVF
jgi:molecular chaperone DnaK (HSP70)